MPGSAEGGIETRRVLAGAGLVPPRTLKLMITGRCNLHCRHCWPEGGPGGAGPVALEVLSRILAQFAELGGEEVCITGGEPLTHPHWRQLLEAAAAEPRLRQIELQTNGTLVGPADLLFLGGLAPDRVTLRLSLDGALAASNDALRGPGVHARVVSLLDSLRRGGLAHRVSLAMTETRENFPEIPELLQLAERYDVPRVETATLVVRGRAALDADVRPPRPDQIDGLLDRYDTDPEFRLRYARLGMVAALEWARWRTQPRSHYCTFVENLFVDARGDLFPCTMYDHPQAAVGSAHHRPLAELLLEGAAGWARLRGLSRARLREPGPCASCPGWDHCRGGCFGRDQEHQGGDPGREDRCALRRAVYRLPAGRSASRQGCG